MRALTRQRGAFLDINILADKPAQDFINTHATMLDQAFATVPMSADMRRRLMTSDYIFSGLKTFHELNEAFPSLIDENGNRKPFEQFYNDVQAINQTYNRNYLRAEYNFAHASAAMAARWEQVAEDGDRYLLQYRTAGDDRVRPEHAALNGITLPPSDPFWRDYYPPNGWNCFTQGTPVLTAQGWMPIEKIKKGDLVVGGSGQLRHVTATSARAVNAQLVRIITKGATTTCTENHRFLTPGGWVAARDLNTGDIIIQVGKVSLLNIVVNAVRNTATVCRKALMAHIAQRKAVPALTIDHQAKTWDVEIYHPTFLQQNAMLEWKGKCREVAGYDFFHLAQWLTQCAHALGMRPAAGKAVGDATRTHVGTKKTARALQLFRNATQKVAVLLRLALTDVFALHGKAVVHRRKARAGLYAAFGLACPLRGDGFATVAHGNAAHAQNLHDSPEVDTPMGGKPSHAPLLHGVTLLRGIREPQAFKGFNALPKLLRDSFLHNRFVLVRGKVNTKQEETTVYNLEIEHDESYIVPIGIAHNCRCTAVQVRRGKYTESDPAQAMNLGQQALKADKKGIFRFNSGQQRKTFPDYNPYTISRCRDCDMAQGNVNLAFVPENELCQACRLIRQCARKKERTCVLETRKGIINNAQKLKIHADTVRTGIYYQTKSSLKRGLAHAYTTEEALMFSWLTEHLEDLRFLRFSPLGENKNLSLEKDIKNIAKKRRRGVTGYNIYEAVIDGITWIIKTEIAKGRAETAYSIMKKK